MRWPLVSTLALVGCAGTGTWQTQTYGEPYIEEEIPAGDFADDCSAVFSTFNVIITEAALVDGDGSDAAAMSTARVFDVTKAGPHMMETLEAPATFYDTARFRIGPDSAAIAGNVEENVASELAGSGDSIHAAGTLTCGTDSVTFDWRFQTDTVYNCEPEDLTIPAGGEHTTELTVHGDHFFYDGLANDDAEVRGTALFDADGDGDGELTLSELAAVPVAPLGYQVGPYSDVTDLRAFVTHLTQTLGHVDGEGHCQVDL